MDLRHLVNGTDIRGVVAEVKDRKKTLGKEEINFIARGLAKWADRKFGRKAQLEGRNIKVSVGYDARHTGPEFSEIIRTVLTDMEIDVYDCQMSITPSLFMTTVFEEYKSDAAVMITASHLPSYYNGLKFFTGEGGLEKSDVIEMLEMAQKGECQCERNMEEALKIEKIKGKVEKRELAQDYANYICELIIKETGGDRKPLKGLKIVIDAGNGAAGFFADKVIERLGGDSGGSQFLNPDGNFPNHVPNPEAKEAIESIKNAVLNNGADFGIIFDADGDRSAFIDKEGREINRNNLIALLSDILLKERKGSTIVTDSVTSAGLKKFIEAKGGVHHRFQRGYKNVINEAKRLNKEGIHSPLAIETSGHAAFMDNYFLDDGAYMAALLLIQLVKSRNEGTGFTHILNEVEQPYEEKEVRFLIKSDDFRKEGNRILEELVPYVEKIEGWELEVPNYEGVRVICDKDNWFLMRLSLHEPLLCLNVETAKEGKVEEILKELYEFLSKYENIQL